MWQVSQLLIKWKRNQQKNNKTKANKWKGGRRGNSWIPHKLLDLWARTAVDGVLQYSQPRIRAGQGRRACSLGGKGSHTWEVYTALSKTSTAQTAELHPPPPLLHFVKIPSLYTWPARHSVKKADTKHLRKSKTGWNWDFVFLLREFCAESRWANGKFSRSTENLMQDQCKAERSVFNRQHSSRGWLHYLCGLREGGVNTGIVYDKNSAAFLCQSGSVSFL